MGLEAVLTPYMTCCIAWCDPSHCRAAWNTGVERPQCPERGQWVPGRWKAEVEGAQESGPSYGRSYSRSNAVKMPTSCVSGFPRDTKMGLPSKSFKASAIGISSFRGFL